MKYIDGKPEIHWLAFRSQGRHEPAVMTMVIDGKTYGRIVRKDMRTSRIEGKFAHLSTKVSGLETGGEEFPTHKMIDVMSDLESAVWWEHRQKEKEAA